MKTFEKKILEEFDKIFPAYKGVGAPFPIFEGNPNRNHVRQFLIKALQQQQEEVQKGFNNKWAHIGNEYTVWIFNDEIQVAKGKLTQTQLKSLSEGGKKK